MDQAVSKEGHQEYNRRGESKFIPRRKVCLFCTTPTLKIDYKDTALLSRFITDQAKIEPRRRSGTCAKHQRMLVQAIKRARHLALLPIAPNHIYKTGGIPPAPPSVAQTRPEAEGVTPEGQVQGEGERAS